MPCEKVIHEGKAIGFACYRGGRRCKWCTNRATKQCDFPIFQSKNSKKTCDAYMCDFHATPVSYEKDLDYCPTHQAAAAVPGGA